MTNNNPILPLKDSFLETLKHLYADSSSLDEEKLEFAYIPSEHIEKYMATSQSGGIGMGELSALQICSTQIEDNETNVLIDDETIEVETANFIKQIKEIEFEDGMYNEAFDKFEDFRNKLGSSFAEWISKVCMNYLNDDDVIIKILTIFADYDFDELSAAQPWIILANISNRSAEVKSAALNVIDNWHNQEALDFLSKFDVPREPWLKLKYMTIKSDIEDVLRA